MVAKIVACAAMALLLLAGASAQKTLSEKVEGAMLTFFGGQPDGARKEGLEADGGGWPQPPASGSLSAWSFLGADESNEREGRRRWPPGGR